MEVKSRQILDVLAELGLAQGKTHSSSLEDYEADKVRAQLRGTKPGGHSSAAGSRAPQGIQPKIDLSHVSKPGDVLKAILAKKQEEEAEARHAHLPVRTQPPVVAAPARPAPPKPPVVAAPTPAPARPEPRRIVPQPRSAPPIIAAPPVPPAIASRPPSGTVVARPPAGAFVAKPPVVVVAPPSGTVVVKPPVATPSAPVSREEQPRAAERPAVKPGGVAHPVTVVATPQPAAAAIAMPEAPAVPVQAVAATATPVSAPVAEPTAIAAAPVSEPREAVKETPVSATVEVVEPEPAVVTPHRPQGHTHTASPTPALPASPHGHASDRTPSGIQSADSASGCRCARHGQPGCRCRHSAR